MLSIQFSGVKYIQVVVQPMPRTLFILQNLNNLPTLPFPQFLTNVCVLVAQSCRFFVTPWTIAHQAPLLHGILQARILSGLPFPSPGVLHYSTLNFFVLPHISGIMQCLSFYDWLISFSIMSSRFIVLQHVSEFPF